MPDSHANRLAVVIPAYRPTGRLLELLAALAERPFASLVVVDDGSGPDFRAVFAQAGTLPGVIVLRHAAHLGRGASLKTGINHTLCAAPDIAGVITAGELADAAQIAGLREKLLADPGTLASDGEWHAIPAARVLSLLSVEANGPEFERSITGDAPANGLRSQRLHFTLMRFVSASLLTALVDNLIFILARHEGATILVSQVLGRALALVFSYFAMRRSVFYSDQEHKIVAPKYLTLVLVSGAVSYGGIRLLGARFGMDAVPAKLIVESLLFLVNFAVQRLFIFSTANTKPRRELPATLIAAVVCAILLVVLAVEAHGFRTTSLFAQDIWEPIGIKRFLRYIGMYLGIAIPLLVMAPWSFAAALTGLTALGTAAAVGPLPLAAVALFLISSCALGARLLGREHDDAPESQLFSTLLGMALWMLLVTLVARLPVNYPAVWLLLLAVPVALDWRGTQRRFQRWIALLRNAELRCVAERAAFALLLFVLLAHWFVALMPETSADGLAMHLAVPANIAINHRLTIEPARFVWAVMPMGTDFAYSVVYLLGGEYAAHLLDYVLLLLLTAVLYYALRRWVSRGCAFLLLALFASSPLVQLVTGSLFVENMQALMVAGMMAALWRLSATGARRYLYIAAVLGGTAMTTKFGSLAFVALALPFLGVEAARHWKQLGARPALVCALAAVLLLGTAVPPYAIAYIKTGNPLFPFLYDKIPSPLIPKDAGLVDERFKRPLTWETPYDLTFYSSKTYEGRDGSFGFQYLLLAPLAAAAILLVRRRDVVSAAVVGLGACAIIMGTQPNARYVYAALPLLSIPLAALLHKVTGTRWLYGGLLACLVAALILNTRFMPSASYYHRDFCLRLPFSRAERDRYRADAVPIREVIAYFNSKHAKSPVMLSNDSAIAGLDADIYENHWHQINHFWQLRAIKGVPAMIQLMQNWKVEYFISPKPGTGDEIKPEAFREMLERCTEAEFERGDMYLARLQPTCRPRQERTAVLVQRGFYDDLDPAVLYRGDWIKDRGFEQPDLHSITYTDVAGAEVEIDFEGKALTYVYTLAPNRGIAAITIDGVDQVPVDLYAPQIAWQSRTRFCCFGPGRHVAVIKLTGKSNPKSSGSFIDLDSFTVE